MAGKVMVLADSLSMREEAVQYSIELAKRMDYSLTLLVLLPLDSEEAAHARDLETHAREALGWPVDSARRAGVQVEVEIRLGDPSSELMKFLASSRSVQTIVWGGTPGLGNLKRRKGHWLFRMKDMLEYPVVIPSIKS
jgi:nucleotide-binding universal stress UspA family protein